MTTAFATDEAETKDDPTATRRQRALSWLFEGRGLRVVAILAAALLVAATVFVTVQWRRAEDLQNARSDALAAARVDAVTIASYDYRTLDDYFSAVGKIATGSFAKQYNDANDNLRSVLRKTKSVVKATIVDAGVESATKDHVVVTLFVDQAVRNAATHGSATDRNRMLMTLDRQDGQWFVSDLQLK